MDVKFAQRTAIKASFMISKWLDEENDLFDFFFSHFCFQHGGRTENHLGTRPADHMYAKETLVSASKTTLHKPVSSGFSAK